MMNAKRFAVVGALCVVCSIVARNAWAGERYLGVIAVTTSSLNNTTTGGTPFVINPGSRITVQCDAVTFIQPDSASTLTTTGIKLAADQIFYTSAGTLVNGTLSGQRTALLAAIVTAGTANCRVWERRGNE